MGSSYTFVSMHVFMWWAKWWLQGILWHNLTSPDGLMITPYFPHPDNFTIVTAQIAYIALSGMMVLAVFYRRQVPYLVAWPYGTAPP